MRTLVSIGFFLVLGAATGCHRHHHRPAHHGAPTVVVYEHGHHRHVCARGCHAYVEPTVVVYGHGHARHVCAQGCPNYRTVVVYSHGHARHVCAHGCAHFRR